MTVRDKAAIDAYLKVIRKDCYQSLSTVFNYSDQPNGLSQ
jgi:hypothetical protein